uniref:Uncharacterized protein n=1 Tax=Fagus sylvatica TaxID=28930 RepID=A0A2N9F676_FAGSY
MGKNLGTKTPTAKTGIVPFHAAATAPRCFLHDVVAQRGASGAAVSPPNAKNPRNLNPQTTSSPPRPNGTIGTSTVHFRTHVGNKSQVSRVTGVSTVGAVGGFWVLGVSAVGPGWGTLGFGGFGGGSQIWVLGVSAVGRGGWGTRSGFWGFRRSQICFGFRRSRWVGDRLGFGGCGGVGIRLRLT